MLPGSPPLGALAVRDADVSTTHATIAAPSVQASAQPRSPTRPAWLEGRSVIHMVRKWVGNTRPAGRVGEPKTGPNMTSVIHTKKISTVPFTGLATRVPISAP